MSTNNTLYDDVKIKISSSVFTFDAMNFEAVRVLGDDIEEQIDKCFDTINKNNNCNFEVNLDVDFRKQIKCPYVCCDKNNGCKIVKWQNCKIL